MSLKPQKHQKNAYEEVKKHFEEGDRSIVIFPTGCGKSFVALQLMEDNRNSNILFISPSKPIRNQMYEYILSFLSTEETDTLIRQEKESKGRELQIEEKVKIILPGFETMLYQTIISKSERAQEILANLSPDFIICDEVHHIKTRKQEGLENDAEETEEDTKGQENLWGTAMVNFVEKNPQAKILGITATPERGDGVNVAIRFFNGKIAKEISLIEALARKDIPIKAPDYVPCVYTLIDEIDEGSIQEQIERYKTINPQKADDLQHKLEEMRKIADSGKGIPDIFTEHLTTEEAKQLGRDKGKYIVFCSSVEDMKQKMKDAKTWFAGVDSEPEIYAVSSEYNYSMQNLEKNKINSQQVIEQFEESQSDHIKLLFSVDLLNEGLHVEDVSGVIMTRKTNSRAIYLQQLGRAISSNPNRPKPIVFDIANNYLTYNIYDELVIAKSKNKNTQKTEIDNIEGLDDIGIGDNNDIESFKIIGIMKDFIELIESSGVASMYFNALRIKDWMENNQTIKPPRHGGRDVSTEEKKLGYALSDIRRKLINPYREKESEEEKKKFIEELEKSKSKITEEQFYEILQIIEEIEKNNIPVYLQNARDIRDWMLANHTTFPPKSSSNIEEESILGTKLVSLRYYIFNPYINKKNDEEKKEFVKSLKISEEEVYEILHIIEEIEKNNIPTFLQNARDIRDWMLSNHTTVPPKGKLGTIRSRLIKPYREKESEEEKKKFIEELEKSKSKITEEQFYEILQIIEEIEKNNIPVYLQNARDIRDWMLVNNTTVPPRGTGRQIPEDERYLGRALGTIKNNLINPYREKESKEEKEKFIEDLEEGKSPITEEQFYEILNIIENIEKNNIPKYLANIRGIKDWMLVNNTTIPPRNIKNASEEEKKLAETLRSIKKNIIDPFKAKQTDEEKEQFVKSWSERKLQPISEEFFYEIVSTYEEIVSEKQNIKTKDIGQATYTATAVECDNASNVIQDLIKTREQQKFQTDISDT